MKMTWDSRRVLSASVLLLGASFLQQSSSSPQHPSGTSWVDTRGPVGRSIGQPIGHPIGQPVGQPIGQHNQKGRSQEGFLLFPDNPSWLQQQQQRQKEFAGATAFVHAVGTNNSAASTVAFSQIPLHLVRKINSIENLTQLFQLFSNNQPEMTPEAYLQEDEGLAERFGDVERKAVPFAKPATCTPELRTVEFEKPSDPTMSYYPQCTRVERCGGCCSHDLLSCQPVETEVAYFQVIKWQYVGGTQMEHRGKELLKLERHKSCRCGCKVKAKDCSRFQRYDEGDCSCVCTNEDDLFKCYAENKTKFWDSRDCVCKCREQSECTTGTFYDQNTCSCILRPGYLNHRGEKFDFQSRNKDTGRLLYSISENEDSHQLTTTVSPAKPFPSKNRRRRRRRNQKNRNKQNSQQAEQRSQE